MSTESYRSPEQGLSSLAIEEAQHLLGYAVAPLYDPKKGFDPEIVYDERYAICEAALQAKANMRSALEQAAQTAGQEVGAEQLASWKPGERELTAIRHGLRRERIRARMLDGFASFIDDGRMQERAMGTPLWRNQQDMMLSTEKFLALKPHTYSARGKGGVISGPPGVGKTGVISAISAACKYNEDPHERVKIIVLENTQNVMHQTHGKAGDRGYGKFAPHLDVGLRYQSEKDLDHDIVIMPFASFNLLMERGEMPDADLVIPDEVDIYCTGNTGENLRKYGADKIVIGLTATPDKATYDLLPHDIYTMESAYRNS